MPTGNRRVVALAEQIAALMHNAASRSDALDAHDMARTFYRRMTIPSRPQSVERPQPKKRVLPASA